MDESELKIRALAGARRAAKDLHSHGRELENRPALAEGTELARAAAAAADRLASLLERDEAPSDPNT